jgi:hypothetical protein
MVMKSRDGSIRIGHKRSAGPAWGPPALAEEASMTSATTKPASGAGGRHAEGRGLGLVMFAAIVLLIAVDVVALYGLCAYGSRENLAAA